MHPVANHLPLLDRQPNKLKPAAKSRLITNQSARPDGNANIGKPEFNRDLLSRGKFSGHDQRPRRTLTDIGAAAGQIFGNAGPQRDQVEGNVEGTARKRAAAPFPTPSMELHSSDCLRRIEILSNENPVMRLESMTNAALAKIVAFEYSGKL